MTLPSWEYLNTEDRAMVNQPGNSPEGVREPIAAPSDNTQPSWLKIYYL